MGAFVEFLWLLLVLNCWILCLSRCSQKSNSTQFQMLWTNGHMVTFSKWSSRSNNQRRIWEHVPMDVACWDRGLTMDCAITSNNEHAAKRYVMTEEKSSDRYPQITIHHLCPLNKRLHKWCIHPLHIYSIFDEKSMYLSAGDYSLVTELKTGWDLGSAENWGWP